MCYNDYIWLDVESLYNGFPFKPVNVITRRINQNAGTDLLVWQRYIFTTTLCNPFSLMSFVSLFLKNKYEMHSTIRFSERENLEICTSCLYD